MESKDMNNKSTPDQMRILMKRMRGVPYVSENKGTTKHELSVRDMLKITRSLNEDFQPDAENTEPVNKKTDQDQANEEKKIYDRLGEGVNIEFTDLIVTDKYVFFGGEVNGVMIFTFKVTGNKEDSGAKFNYLEGFNPDDEENKRIKDELELYYNDFEEYWMSNAIQKIDNGELN